MHTVSLNRGFHSTTINAARYVLMLALACRWYSCWHSLRGGRYTHVFVTDSFDTKGHVLPEVPMSDSDYRKNDVLPQPIQSQAGLNRGSIPANTTEFHVEFLRVLENAMEYTYVY
jgi:hypothetical protein